MSFFDQLGTLLSKYDVVGAFMTNIQLTFWAAIGSFVLGTVLALMRISPVPSLRWVGTAYVHTVRNTPLTIMMTFAILGVWTQFQLSFSHDFDTNFFVYAVIALSILAEARGDQKVVAFNRTIPESSLRIAISVIVMGATVVGVGSAAILIISGADLKEVIFEVISAFATCGLSDGLSSNLPPSGIYVLSVLMLIGRVGTTTAATGLALRSRRRLYKFPEERPTIG